MDVPLNVSPALAAITGQKRIAPQSPRPTRVGPHFGMLPARLATSVGSDFGAAAGATF
jgi:hypothetical protein